MNEYTVLCDTRLSNCPRYFMGEENRKLMLVPDEIRKCAVFLCYKTGISFNLAGTAFFVTIPCQTDFGKVFIYLVTAKHVISGIERKGDDQKVYVRINKRSGNPVIIETKLNEWKFHDYDPTVDVATIPFLVPFDVFDFKAISIKMAATEGVIEKESIGVGDEIFLTGLFLKHSGINRNVPIIRIGNISLMPIPEEPIKTQLGMIEGYVVEVRSMGGLSGSPVFVNTTGIRRMNNKNIVRSQKFFWLGLMHGHWNLSEEDEQEMFENLPGRESLNAGMSIVVPVSKIIEVINGKELTEMRNIEEQKLINKSSPVPDKTDKED